MLHFPLLPNLAKDKQRAVSGCPKSPLNVGLLKKNTWSTLLILLCSVMVLMQTHLPNPRRSVLIALTVTHKSHRVAKRMICFSRKWFAIWMGYLSYLTAKTSTLVPSGVPDQSSPLPDWYNHLRNEHGFSLAWLDGLLTSTVCTFDRATPRTGIVFQWSEENRLRESIEWYFNHHIPLFFVWSSKEEQIILYDRSLAHLQPPDNLVKEALIQLFSDANLPLPSLIIQKYFRLGDNPIMNKTVQLLRLQYAPSLIFELTTNKFLAQESPIEAGADASLQTLAVEWENKRQAAAQAASSFPYHGLQTTFQDSWKQFAASSSTANDWAASSSNWGATSSMSNDWAAASSVSNDWPTGYNSSRTCLFHAYNGSKTKETV